MSKQINEKLFGIIHRLARLINNYNNILLNILILSCTQLSSSGKKVFFTWYFTTIMVDLKNALAIQIVIYLKM